MLSVLISAVGARAAEAHFASQSCRTRTAACVVFQGSKRSNSTNRPLVRRAARADLAAFDSLGGAGIIEGMHGGWTASLGNLAHYLDG